MSAVGRPGDSGRDLEASGHDLEKSTADLEKSRTDLDKSRSTLELSRNDPEVCRNCPGGQTSHLGEAASGQAPRGLSSGAKTTERRLKAT